MLYIYIYTYIHTYIHVIPPNNITPPILFDFVGGSIYEGGNRRSGHPLNKRPAPQNRFEMPL